MKPQHLTVAIIGVASVLVLSVVLAAPDRFTLKEGNGIAFSKFRGYDAWQMVAVSRGR